MTVPWNPAAWSCHACGEARRAVCSPGAWRKGRDFTRPSGARATATSSLVIAFFLLAAERLRHDRLLRHLGRLEVRLLFFLDVPPKCSALLRADPPDHAGAWNLHERSIARPNESALW